MKRGCAVFQRPKVHDGESFTKERGLQIARNGRTEKDQHPLGRRSRAGTSRPPTRRASKRKKNGSQERNPRIRGDKNGDTMAV